MKRGEPLKRKTPLERGTAPLRRSEGLGRGNGPVARSRPQTGRERPAKAKRAPKVKATIPKRVREHVYAREEGRCVRCRRVVGRGLFERALHHLLPERTWPEFVAVAANIVLVCAKCHAEHEFGARDDSRFAIEHLPVVSVMWLQLRAARPDGGPIAAYLTRTYRDWP